MSSFVSGRSKKRSWEDISDAQCGTHLGEQVVLERKRKYMRVKDRVTAALRGKIQSFQNRQNENMLHMPLHSSSGSRQQGSVSCSISKFTRSEVAATVLKVAQEEQINRIQSNGLSIDPLGDAELWKILEEDLIQELEKEELMVQEQCKSMEDYDQGFLAQYSGHYGDIAQKQFTCPLEGLDKVPTQSSLVLCPVCQQSNLLQLKSIVFCGCGMRIDTGPSDGLSLEYIGERLANVLNNHYSTSCTGRPVFETKQLFGGVTNLIMECKVCNKLEIII